MIVTNKRKPSQFTIINHCPERLFLPSNLAPSRHMNSIFVILTALRDGAHKPLFTQHVTCHPEGSSTIRHPPLISEPGQKRTPDAPTSLLNPQLFLICSSFVPFSLDNYYTK